jgi:hypothetical protein
VAEKKYKPEDLNKDDKVTAGERKKYRENKTSEFYAENLPAQYALLSQDPEVKKLIDDAVREYLRNPEGFSQRAFEIKLDSMPYFQGMSKAAIRDMDLQQRLPAVWEQEVNAELETLRDQAVQMGVKATDESLRDLVVRKRRTGMSESQLQNALSQMVTVQEGRLAGQAGELQQSLKSWAMRNGLGLSDNLIQDYVRKIQAGDTTQADVLSDLRRTYMAGAYPAWADRIDAGMDIADIAAPYKSAMAQLLEVGEDEIDLNDQLLQRGLQGVGADGKPSVVPLYAFQKEIRKDPRWQKTDNAYASYASVADNILSMFGFR